MEATQIEEQNWWGPLQQNSGVQERGCGKLRLGLFANCLITKRTPTCLGRLGRKHQRAEQTLPVTSTRGTSDTQKNLSSIKFAIHAFFHFFGWKVFQRVRLKEFLMIESNSALLISACS